MTVVSKSPVWGANSAPRIISPSRYITATDPAIRAPRPGRFNSKWPAPGISQARRTAENHLFEETGAAAGAGVTGRLAPGRSLTALFYSIGGRPPQTDPHAEIAAAGSPYKQRHAGSGFQELQFPVLR